MIFSPKIGRRYRVHYKCKTMPYHGKVGICVSVGISKGPRNVAIKLNTGEIVCVPRGNLKKEEL